jgi:hypothetical protein
LYLISGSEGTGKSSILHTICEGFSKRGRLGASFFFSRNQEVRNKAEPLIRTLAYKLSCTLPLRGYISEALDDTTLLRASPTLQFQELIIRPLEKLHKSNPLPFSILIAIDALDECDGENSATSITHFIPILAKELAQTSVSLKVLLTSRPNRVLAGMFPPQTSYTGRRLLSLDDIGASVVDRDLRLYITHKLEVFNEGNRVDGWPKEDDIKALVKLSSGVFISANKLLKSVEFRARTSNISSSQGLSTLLATSFIMAQTRGRAYKLVNVRSGTVADLSGNDWRSVLGWEDHGGDNQKVRSQPPISTSSHDNLSQWIFEDKDFCYAIKNKKSGKYLCRRKT